MGVDDGQDAQLPARGQLIVNEIHGLDLVRMCGIGSILPELGLHPPFGGLVAQLQAQLVVKPAGSLHVDRPSLTQQKDVHTPVAVANACLTDLLDPLLQRSLLATPGLVGVERAVDPQRMTRLADRHLPGLPDFIHKLASAGRLQSFFERTSCSMALSRLRSATSRLSLAFSSSSWRNRLTSDGIRPA